MSEWIGLPVTLEGGRIIGHVVESRTELRGRPLHRILTIEIDDPIAHFLEDDCSGLSLHPHPPTVSTPQTHPQPLSTPEKEQGRAFHWRKRNKT